MSTSKSIKRKAEDTFKAKRVKLNEECTNISLDTLPDDVLYIILSYLDATSLYNLKEASRRLECLCEEDVFWKRIDARRKPFTLETILYCLKRTDANTIQLSLSGRNRSDDIMSLPLSVNIKTSQSLRVLALENQTINGDEVTLNQFPETLEELSLRRAFVLSSVNFFKQTCNAMNKLKVLILDHCKWMTAENLLPISRYNQLEILSLYMCTNLMDEICYTSMSCKYGFTNLRVLNIRFIGMGDQILKSMYKHGKLQEIYFQNYQSTYKKSCKKRKADIENGAQMEDIVYLSDDDAPMDVITKKYFAGNMHCRKNFEMVTKRGIEMYVYTQPKNDKDDYVVNSILYKDQYGDCKCGFFNAFREIADRLMKEPTECVSNGEPVEHSALLDELSVILNEQMSVNWHPKMMKLPMEDLLKEANAENQSHLWLYLRKPLNDYEISMYENIPRNIIKSLLFFGNVYKKIQNRKSDEETNTNGAGPSGLNNVDDENNSVSPLIGTFDVDSFNVSHLMNQVIVPLRSVRATLPQPNEMRPINLNFPFYRDLMVLNSNNKSQVEIRKLSFRGYRTVDDSCLDAVKHLNLDLLDVTQTSVTNKALHRFMLSNPQCRLVHENACVCEPRLHF